MGYGKAGGCFAGVMLHSFGSYRQVDALPTARWAEPAIVTHDVAAYTVTV
jgi:hypothetical protein